MVTERYPDCKHHASSSGLFESPESPEAVKKKPLLARIGKTKNILESSEE